MTARGGVADQRSRWRAPVEKAGCQLLNNRVAAFVTTLLMLGSGPEVAPGIRNPGLGMEGFFKLLFVRLIMVDE
jgi:hypothetical protein